MAEKAPLSTADWLGAAWMLECDPLMIAAVARVEAPFGGFLSDGQCRILFERHWFHRFTEGRFSRQHPGISNPDPGGYLGAGREHDRLGRAAKLDRIAAVQSASWGKFQIMGFNHRFAGFQTIQGFLNAMILGDEADHLRAFVAFIRWDEELHLALMREDETRFAKIYNGRGYKKNRYDEKIRRELDRLRAAVAASSLARVLATV